MSRCYLKNIQPVSIGNLKTGVFLAIIQPNRVPPHLSLIVGGKTFSLSAKGATTNEPVEVILRTAQIKKMELLFIELKVPMIFAVDDLQKEITTVTNAYSHLDAGNITCLSPIKDFCHNIYETDTNSVKFVFDLVPQLQEQQAVRNCFQLNMSHLLGLGNSFQLQTYSMFEVSEAIANFQNQLA